VNIDHLAPVRKMLKIKQPADNAEKNLHSLLDQIVYDHDKKRCGCVEGIEGKALWCAICANANIYATSVLQGQQSSNRGTRG
jgi:hypothetical protein